MTTHEIQTAIGGMTYPDCIEVREAIEQRIDELQTTKVEELQQRFRDELAALGLDGSVVIDGPRGKKRRGRGTRNGQATL